MKILLFGGTTEGRLLAEELAALGHSVTVSVATGLGAEELRRSADISVRTGRLTAEEIRTLVKNFALCVDATHPYAEEISRNVRKACQAEGIPLRRVLREAAFEEERPGVRYAGSAKEAAELLAETDGRVLLTTGAKELGVFSGIDPERLFVRLLPSHEGLSACEAMGIPHRNVIAMQGPFTKELNEAILKQFTIRILVTKDSGSAGGFSEKLAAAEAADAEVIVIKRPRESGISREELLLELRRMQRTNNTTNSPSDGLSPDGGIEEGSEAAG